MKRPLRLPAWAAVLPLLAAYAVLKHAFGILICDDAYITLAHARSWVAGLGPVMSAQNPVCATSTPLHTALLALIGWASGSEAYPAFAYALNAGWDLIGFFYLFRLARGGLNLSGPWPFLAVAAYAFSVNALAVSASGMETPMYVALGLAGTWYALYAGNAWPGLGLIALLAPLARPEGALLPAILILLRRRRMAGFDRTARLSAAAAALGLCLFFAFNLYAYGHALPHSIVAKRLEIHVGPIEGLRAWALNVFFKGPCFGGTRTLALLNALILGAAIAGWARRPHSAMAARAPSGRPGTGEGPSAGTGARDPLPIQPNRIPLDTVTQRVPWPVLAWPGAYFLFLMAAGASYALFPWYFLPVLPFLILVLIGGLARLGDGMPPAAAWALFFGFMAWVPAQTFRQKLPEKHRSAEAGREGRYREAARILDSISVPGTPATIMIDEVGAIGYASHARILDTHGLLSPEALPYLGPAAGYWLRMAKMQDKLDPEWIVGLRPVKDEGWLYQGEDGFYAGYGLYRILRMPGHPYNLEIWRRLPPD